MWGWFVLGRVVLLCCSDSVPCVSLIRGLAARPEGQSKVNSCFCF